MELLQKIRHDYEFYCHFTESARKFFKKEDNYLCEAWIQKLTGEQYTGIGNQSNRNIFLANLVLCIQKGKLTEPFTEYPADCGLPNAHDIFSSSIELKEPAWLNSVVDNDTQCNIRAKDKRTYLATKTMPDNKGALGYIAVSLAKGESQWIKKDGGFFENCEYNNKIEKSDEKKDNERNDDFPNQSLDYYQFMLNEIKKELTGNQSGERSEGTERLIKLLIDSLQTTGTIHQYNHLQSDVKRRIFLTLLKAKLKKRIHKLTKEKNIFKNNFSYNIHMKQHRFDTGDSESAKKIVKFDSKMSMKKLYPKLKEIYPEFIVNKFMHLLMIDKEKITQNIKEKYYKRVVQIKNGLYQEYAKNQKKCEDAQYAYDEIKTILEKYKETAAVNEQNKKQKEEEKNIMYRERQETCNRLKKYKSEAEKLLMEEEKRNQWLNEQLKNTELQTKRYKKFHKENLKRIEEASIYLMNDIKMLSQVLRT